MEFNPKVEKFVEDNPDQTMLGLAWSLFWRLYSVVFIIAFILAIISEL